ncbi:hypothetical protein ACJIZ3_015590 [Penstemon smallii]|uniref:Rhodopsin n=1 Tax=Penstemon smallii TaxID=265156 RepID=A0ABD3RMY3_9LAMI
MSYYNQNQPPVGVPPPQGYPPEGYPKDAYPPQGYPPQGYPPQGYPQQGYPPQGYPPQYAPQYGAPPPQKQSNSSVWLLFVAVASWMHASDEEEIMERVICFDWEKIIALQLVEGLNSTIVVYHIFLCFAFLFKIIWA